MNTMDHVGTLCDAVCSINSEREEVRSAINRVMNEKTYTEYIRKYEGDESGVERHIVTSRLSLRDLDGDLRGYQLIGLILSSKKYTANPKSLSLLNINSNHYRRAWLLIGRLTKAYEEDRNHWIHAFVAGRTVNGYSVEVHGRPDDTYNEESNIGRPTLEECAMFDVPAVDIQCKDTGICLFDTYHTTLLQDM